MDDGKVHDAELVEPPKTEDELIEEIKSVFTGATIKQFEFGEQFGHRTCVIITELPDGPGRFKLFALGYKHISVGVATIEKGVPSPPVVHPSSESQPS